jgi:hypothetical protein
MLLLRAFLWAVLLEGSLFVLLAVGLIITGGHGESPLLSLFMLSHFVGEWTVGLLTSSIWDKVDGISAFLLITLVQTLANTLIFFCVMNFRRKS